MQLCPSGSWPAGPFTGGDDVGAQAAAAAVAVMAAAITARRRQLRWSRAALAEQSGVGQHTVGRIEAGRTWPDVATVARLARVLGLELSLATHGEAPAAAGAPTPRRSSLRHAPRRTDR